MPIHFDLISLGLLMLGFSVGVYSSIVGGGAIVMVPALTLIGMPLPGAIATMRASAAVSQFVSVLAFWQKRDITWNTALWGSLCVIPGAYIGTGLVIQLDPKLLSYMIAALLVALYFLTPDLKNYKGPKKLTKHWLPLLGFGCFVLGIYGGFYGAAFATFLMFFFMALGGINLITASGNASVVTLSMSVISSYYFIRAGLVNWEVFVPIALGGSLGSWAGVELADKYGFGWVKILLHGVIILSVIKLVVFPG